MRHAHFLREELAKLLSDLSIVKTVELGMLLYAALKTDKDTGGGVLGLADKERHLGVVLLDSGIVALEELATVSMYSPSTSAHRANRREVQAHLLECRRECLGKYRGHRRGWSSNESPALHNEIPRGATCYALQEQTRAFAIELGSAVTYHLDNALPHTCFRTSPFNVRRHLVTINERLDLRALEARYVGTFRVVFRSRLSSANTHHHNLVKHDDVWSMPATWESY